MTVFLCMMLSALVIIIITCFKKIIGTVYISLYFSHLPLNQNNNLTDETEHWHNNTQGDLTKARLCMIYKKGNGWRHQRCNNKRWATICKQGLCYMIIYR